MNSIEVYAELLTNIRTVTLVASLRTESNQETKAELSADGQTITINHEGHSASIRLPTQMVGGGTAALTLPATSSKDLTLRLQLEEKVPGLLKFENGPENLVPWPASAVSDGIQCLECATSFLKVGHIKEWRDLPSENWAEMMDFWHCHKPHEHNHDHSEVAKSKGYSSSSKLQATSSVGYVGLSYILFSEDDCCNVEIVKTGSDRENPAELQCASCRTVVGTVDPIAQGWKYYKWSIQIQKDSATFESFGIQKWMSTQLLAAIENSGVRRFIVEGKPGTSEERSSILLWIFTDDLSFSSSVQNSIRHDPTRAMKIFWKPVQNPTHILESTQFSHEQLLFPANTFASLKKGLEESALLLPLSARRFQDWKVGLLERFTHHDVIGSDATVLSPPHVYKEEAGGMNQNFIREIPNSEALLE